MMSRLLRTSIIILCLLKMFEKVKMKFENSTTASKVPLQ